jgi:hypothetical protein
VYVKATIFKISLLTRSRLYPPTIIKASGPVQDGGMSGHNNPVNLALWECRHIEPSVTKPDIVLSLGTGTEKPSTSSITTGLRHVILDGYISRLWRSYMSSFNGQNIRCSVSIDPLSSLSRRHSHRRKHKLFQNLSRLILVASAH